MVRDCLGVREGEEVLVVANPATIGLGERFRGEAGRLGADGVLCLIAERAESGTEPPRLGRGGDGGGRRRPAARPCSRSRTPPRAGPRPRPGSRIATLPGATEEMLARVMSADIEGLRRKGEAIAAALTAGSEARITCANGSDLRLGLGEREAIADAGDLTAPGAFGNLPCGEGFIAPIEGTAEGTLVVDGTIASIGRVAEPVELTVEGGHLVSATGEAGARAARPPAHQRRRAGHQRRRARDRHQREGRADRRAARGREAPRHLPRRLRRLGRDRGHGPGPGAPRLRRAEARRQRRRRAARARGRAPGRLSRRGARGPQLLRGARRRRDRGDQLRLRRRRAARPPLRRGPQPHRAHASRARGPASGRGAGRRRRAPASSGST